MKGFALQLYPSPDQTAYNKIKEWGFSTVQYSVFWGNLSNEDGSFRDDWIWLLNEEFKKARSAGLKIVLCLRVQYYVPNESWEYPGWQTPATHDYVNLTDEGRRRYCSFLEKVVIVFPNVDIYCPWHYVYHRQLVDDERRNTYVNVTFPAMLAAMRKHTSKPIVFSPPHQGVKDIVGQADADFYLDFTKYSDGNIIYAVSHMVKWQVLTGQEEWDRDVSKIDVAFEGVRVFRQKYPSVSMYSIEFAPWYRATTPLSAVNLEYFNEVLKRMSQHHVGFQYWRLEPPDYPSEDIINAMQAVMIVPPLEEDNRFLLLFFILSAVLLIVLFGLKET